jgi:ssDNA-binding Zn-finger/Zn-ribbon topoisomerase 1
MSFGCVKCPECRFYHPDKKGPELDQCDKYFPALTMMDCHKFQKRDADALLAEREK